MPKQGRTTVYNQIVTKEKLDQVNKENITLMKDFLDYLRSVDRSKSTVDAYWHDLTLFFCWNLSENDNKFFVDMNKREFARFQNYGLNELGWSSNRVRRVKSTLSSLSNYLENICDDIYVGYRPIVRKIESPVKEPVREKTVISDEEAKRLLDTLVERKQYQRACAVALAMFCGCRKSEILRFKVDYFKDENIIFDAIYKTPEKIKTKGRGKGKFLNKYVLIEFKQYLDLWMQQREELGIESEWIFVSKKPDGTYDQATIAMLDGWTDSFSEILGQPFYFHMLRHYVITRFRKMNIPSNVIVEWTGWSDESMISVYDDSEAIDDFGKYFSADGIIKQEEKGLSDL